MTREKQLIGPQDIGKLPSDLLRGDGDIAPYEMAMRPTEDFAATAGARVAGLPPSVLLRAGRKIDLACGQSCKEGFEGVDLYAPNVSTRWDLNHYPWPFPDGCAAELFSSHYIEHIPADVVPAWLAVKDVTACDADPAEWQHEGRNERAGQDALFAFFDECYRILEPGGVMIVQCPNARSNRAFQDPTHRRFIVAETFLYLNAEWRAMNKLDHYNVQCNFGGNIAHTMLTELNLLAPEVAAKKMSELWNQIPDWVVTLKSLKQ